MMSRIASDRLLELYQAQRLSQRSIAEITGLPQTTISRYLRKLGASEPLRRRNQRGDLNYSFKDGLSRSTVNRVTKALLEGAGTPLNVCQRCHQAYDRNLDRHHKDRNRANNDTTNIEVVCPACHAREHNPERQRDAWGRYVA